MASGGPVLSISKKKKTKTKRKNQFDITRLSMPTRDRIYHARSPRKLSKQFRYTFAFFCSYFLLSLPTINNYYNQLGINNIVTPETRALFFN